MIFHIGSSPLPLEIFVFSKVRCLDRPFAFGSYFSCSVFVQKTFKPPKKTLKTFLKNLGFFQPWFDVELKLATVVFLWRRCDTLCTSCFYERRRHALHLLKLLTRSCSRREIQTSAKLSCNEAHLCIPFRPTITCCCGEESVYRWAVVYLCPIAESAAWHAT